MSQDVAQEKNQVPPMLELNHKPNFNGSRVRREPENKQPRRLLLALTLLLVALVAVVLRDSQFWFGSDDSTIADSSTSAVAKTPANSASTAEVSKSVPAPAAKKSAAGAKSKAENTTAEPTTESATTPADSGATTINRTVLPPMDIEVVAGDNHRVIRPGSNAMKVEIPKTASAIRQASASGAVTDAADREPVAVATSIPAQGSYEATYPLLSQHTNVQGSVVLQAVIGADGIIENLHVLSGPAILASAAQQAVRDWRFKPIVQNGQAVESKARITVNFIIKISDNSTKTTLAESRSQNIRLLSR
jgi:TonB family protein